MYLADFWFFLFGLRQRYSQKMLNVEDDSWKSMDIEDQYAENVRLDNEKLSKRPFLKFILNILILLSYLSVVIAYLSIFAG